MRYFWILILAGVFALGAKIYLGPEVYFSERKHATPANSEIIKLAFVGDIMMDREVEKKILKEGAGDFRFPFLNIASELSEYDFLFGNLEGPISSRGKNAGSAYSFRMDARVIGGLKFAGFDAMSVANNHSGDWGKEAFSDTLSILREANIIPAGATTSPEIFEIKGLKLGLLAFSDFPGLGIRADDEVVKKGVSWAKSAADLIVVSFHFGEEYKKEPSLRQIKLAKIAIDAGADLVIGHHPHVTQPVEKYVDSYIAYSLGNFVFDQNFSEETMTGLLLEVEIRDKKILSVKTREIKLNLNYQPLFID